MFFNVLRPVGLPDLLVIHTEVVVVSVVIVQKVKAIKGLIRLSYLIMGPAGWESVRGRSLHAAGCARL